LIRFILALFGKQYESCKTCEVYKQQIEYERAEKEMLLETLTSLLKPQVIVSQPSPDLKPITPRFQLFSKRKIELEKADAARARTLKTSLVVGKADSELRKPKEIKITNSNKEIPIESIKVKTVEELEKELGIEEVVS